METNVDLNGIYAPSEDVAARDVHGEFIIIPISSGVGDSEDAIFSLNNFGKVIWDKLDGKTSLKQVAGALALQFKGSVAQIEKDVLGLAQELLKRKMIVAI
jgi:hypothetical protein